MNRSEPSTSSRINTEGWHRPELLTVNTKRMVAGGGLTGEGQSTLTEKGSSVCCAAMEGGLSFLAYTSYEEAKAGGSTQSRSSHHTATRRSQTERSEWRLGPQNQRPDGSPTSWLCQAGQVLHLSEGAHPSLARSIRNRCRADSIRWSEHGEPTFTPSSHIRMPGFNSGSCRQLPANADTDRRQ